MNLRRQKSLYAYVVFNDEEGRKQIRSFRSESADSLERQVEAYCDEHQIRFAKVEVKHG